MWSWTPWGCLLKVWTKNWLSIIRRGFLIIGRPTLCCVLVRHLIFILQLENDVLLSHTKLWQIWSLVCSNSLKFLDIDSHLSLTSFIYNLDLVQTPFIHPLCLLKLSPINLFQDCYLSLQRLYLWLTIEEQGITELFPLGVDHFKCWLMPLSYLPLLTIKWLNEGIEWLWGIILVKFKLFNLLKMTALLCIPYCVRGLIISSSLDNLRGCDSCGKWLIGVREKLLSGLELSLWLVMLHQLLFLY